jgi:hypothetical protein
MGPDCQLDMFHLQIGLTRQGLLLLNTFLLHEIVAGQVSVTPYIKVAITNLVSKPMWLRTRRYNTGDSNRQ